MILNSSSKQISISVIIAFIICFCVFIHKYLQYQLELSKNEDHILVEEISGVLQVSDEEANVLAIPPGEKLYSEKEVLIAGTLCNRGLKDRFTEATRNNRLGWLALKLHSSHHH